MCMYIYIYIYMYREREREREPGGAAFSRAKFPSRIPKEV